MTVLGLFQGRVGRQHGLDHQDALVLVGQIGRGHPPEEEAHRRHDQNEDDQVAELVGQRRARPASRYRSRIQKKMRSNQRKNGRRNQTPPSAGSCPLGTGLRSEAHSTGVRIRATTTDSSMEAMMVTENWR